MSLKRFTQDTAIYGIATVLPRIVTVLLVRLFTKNLDTGQFSEATEFWVYAAFFNVLLTYGMETSFFRLFTKLNKNKKVLNTAFTSILLTSLIALGLLLFFRNEISTILNVNNVTLITFLIWVTILDTIVVIPYAYLRISNRPIRFAFYKIFNVFIYLIIILFLFEVAPYLKEAKLFDISSITNYLNSENDVVFIFIANLCASACTLLLFFPVLKKFHLSIDKIILTKMLKYGLPIMIAGLAYVVNENIDKLLLKEMLGENIMGAYGATYKIGVFMTLFITAFRMGAEPFFFSQSKEKDAKQNYAKILFWFTIVGVIFYVAIVAYMDIIASIFIRQEEYYLTIAIVPVILLANLMLGIYHNLSIWYKLTDKTRYAMYLSIFGAIITITLNIILIPRIGFMGSAWATVAAYGSMTVASYLIGRKHYFVPYKTTKIVFYTISSAIISYIIFNWFYDDFFIKTFILIGFISMIYFLERKEIHQMIKK